MSKPLIVWGAAWLVLSAARRALGADERGPRTRIMTLVLTWFVMALSLSAQPAPAPALEQEARQIDSMLIAPCCWLQPVSVHQSAAAEEVKESVRRMLRSGMTCQQVLDAFVDQYGERILAEPRNRGFGRSLYLMPWVLGGGTALGVGFFLRRVTRRQHPAEKAVVPDGTLDPRLVDRLDDELRDLD